MPNRDRLRIHLRQRQLVNETGNVVVQCNPDGSAEYVPGSVDQTWVDYTEFATGLDKLNLSWDFVNSNSSNQSTDTNPGGSNYDKGITVAVTFNDRAFQFIKSILDDAPCGVLNSVEAMITDELCQKRYRTFEIKADNLAESPFDAPCEYDVKLREADPVWHCVHKTFIWDNWQDWFIDGSSKQHPCFLTGVEPRPRLLSSARMGLSIFGRTIPLFSAIFNESDDAFRRILNVDNFVDAPLVRDFISNVTSKCGLAVDTIFHDPASPVYDLCLYYPLSGAMHTNDSSAVTSPGLSFHFENRWNITLAELLDKLKVIFNAEWYVTPNNTLVFKPRATFRAGISTPIYDFAAAGAVEFTNLRYTFNGKKKPAYGRYQYQIDASDLASQELQPLYNDIVDYDGPTDNLMLEGNVSKSFEFASTGAIRDGRAKEDYLVQTISDGETVAYALVVVVAVVVAALFAGALSVIAAAALAAFLGLWVANIAGKANDLRDDFQDAKYTGAVRLTSEQVATPRLILWDGESMNRAKMPAVAPGTIAANTYYNPDSEPYTTRNKFQYVPSAIYNYPMFFDSYFLGNLFDTYHDAVDNPLKSLDSNRTFEMSTDLCCEMLDILGVWQDSFAKIGYFIRIESRPGVDIMGRLEHFDIDYENEQINLKGQMFKVKT